MADTKPLSSDGFRAVPIPETVQQVEQAVCRNCHQDVFRIPPGESWWHRDTGLTNCFVR